MVKQQKTPSEVFGRRRDAGAGLLRLSVHGFAFELRRVVGGSQFGRGCGFGRCGGFGWSSGFGGGRRIDGHSAIAGSTFSNLLFGFGCPVGGGPRGVLVSHAGGEVLQDFLHPAVGHIPILEDSLHHESLVGGDIGEELAAAESVIGGQQSQQSGAGDFGGALWNLVKPRHDPHGFAVAAEHCGHGELPFFTAVAGFECEVVALFGFGGFQADGGEHITEFCFGDLSGQRCLAAGCLFFVGGNGPHATEHEQCGQHPSSQTLHDSLP